MTEQEQVIAQRCHALGIDKRGLQSIRNFIAAAFYHVRLPGTLPADEHLAFNTAIRHATNRIACQGRDGSSRAMSRLLSRQASELREVVLSDDAIPAAAKLGRWLKLVTEEHQEPALSVEGWIRARLDTITIDDVVNRLLTSPLVIVTREEERAIPGRYRRSGSPAERYKEAGIEPVAVEEGTAEFFRSRLAPRRSRRLGKYYVEPEPFEFPTSPMRSE